MSYYYNGKFCRKQQIKLKWKQKLVDIRIFNSIRIIQNLNLENIISDCLVILSVRKKSLEAKLKN